MLNEAGPCGTACAGRRRMRLDLFVALLCLVGLLSFGCKEAPSREGTNGAMSSSPWRGGSALSMPPSSDPFGVTLLLTNPTAETARNWVELVSSGMLRVARLRIVGVYHADQTLASIETRDYLASRKVDWLTLRRIDCPLGDDPFVYSPKCRHSYRELFDEADGLILSPGPDLPPRDYGETTSLLARIGEVQRTRFELSLLAFLFGTGGYKEVGSPYIKHRPEFVVLGIGLGMQELNVALGGTLVQDIPTEIYGASTAEKVLEMEPVNRHESYEYFRFPGERQPSWVRHPIVFNDEWKLREPRFSDITEAYVLSRHHQAVENLGVDLFPLATSVDGFVVEALGHRSYPGVLGVQFEPESSDISINTRGPLALADKSDLGEGRLEDMVEFHRVFFGGVVKLVLESNAARTGRQVGTPETSTGRPSHDRPAGGTVTSSQD